MRQDAADHRQRLIAAARELFWLRGYDVPLREVAIHAGVGRGTLYRNFPDRRALAVAMLEDALERLHALVAETDGRADQIIVILRTMADLAVDLRAVGEALRGAVPDDPYMDDLNARSIDLLREPLVRAQDAGILAAGLSPADLPVMAVMIGGAARYLSGDARAKAIDAALELLLTGVRGSTWRSEYV